MRIESSSINRWNRSSSAARNSGIFGAQRERQLFVSDVGIMPRLSAQQYGEIFQDIRPHPAEFLERPDASELLRGRTFARTLQLASAL